ncbi:MAG: hypothetical protein M1133_00830 [Armatimonadetes bacterium]|nr:hypothetical protein [Armatimonadota bacterium]
MPRTVPASFVMDARVAGPSLIFLKKMSNPRPTRLLRFQNEAAGPKPPPEAANA